MQQDYYNVLGVNSSSTESEIKKAYRKLAIQHHPDKNKGAESERFKQIAEAYETLGNKDKKSAYDNKRYPEVKINPDEYFSREGTLSDAVRDMFKGVVNNFTGRQTNKRGDDVQIRLTVTLEDIYNEKTKKIRRNVKKKCNPCNGKGGADFQTCEYCRGRGKRIKNADTVIGSFKVDVPCEYCSGEGRRPGSTCNNCYGSGVLIKNEEVEIKTPKAAHDGMKLIKKSLGDYKKGSEVGDLYVIIAVEEHEIYTREGDNILYEHETSILKAIVGGEITVPTLNGKAKLRINADSVGKTYRLSNKGLNGGDMMVSIVVFIPRRDDITGEDNSLLHSLSSNFNPE